MKRSIVLVLALAGCPAKGGTGPVAPVGGGGGCPAANAVYMASYLQPEDGSKETHTGWVLPLANKKLASVQGQPEFAELDAAGAQAAGVPAAPASMWLLVPGTPPCKLTAGAYYAAAIDEGAPNLAYGVELTGCAAPQDAQTAAAAVVLASDASPGDCQLLPPKPAAARLGEADQQGHWQRPTKETPIPAAFEAVIPQHACAAPGCEKLYAVASVEIGGKPVVWAGAVNWLRADAGDPCKWKGDTFSGFFLVSGETLVQVTEGQEHPDRKSVV